MLPGNTLREIGRVGLLALVLILASLLLCGRTAGQRPRPSPREANGWNPGEYELEEVPAAARADARLHVDRLIALLKATPPLAAPGFPIYTHVQADVDVENRSRPVAYDISLAFYRQGMVGTAMDDQVRIRVNDPGTLWDSERAQSAHTFGERELYLEPRFERSWHGYPLNGRDYIVVARQGRELFRPVSLQEYYALLLSDLRDKSRDDGSGVYAAMIRRVQDKYAALSPARHAAPAHACMDAFDEDTYLCEPTTEGARRLVEFNPQYWDRAASRTAPQLLVLYRYNPEKRDGPVGQALSSAWDGLDWGSWRRLLEPARP